MSRTSQQDSECLRRFFLLPYFCPFSPSLLFTRTLIRLLPFSLSWTYTVHAYPVKNIDTSKIRKSATVFDVRYCWRLWWVLGVIRKEARSFIEKESLNVAPVVSHKHAIPLRLSNWTIWTISVVHNATLIFIHIQVPTPTWTRGGNSSMQKTYIYLDHFFFV